MADAKFTARITEMQTITNNNATYLKNGSNGRKWFVPTEAGWTFEPTDLAELGTPFDRADLNQDYEDAYSTAGKATSAAMVASIQLSYLSCMERAFRERHRTLTRSFAHTQGRFHAHGDANNSVFLASVHQYIDDLSELA